jgi:hypothetical protein
MRHLAALVSPLLVALLAGCSSSDSDSDRSNLPIYLIGVESERLEVVTRAVPTERTGTPREKAVAAVEALFSADENGKDQSSLWGTMCGLATAVKSIEPPSSTSPIVVTLTGHGAAACDISEEGYNLRIQQMAWTVVKNLGVADTSVLRVEGSSFVWDSVTPDAAYLATDTG